MSVTGFDGQLLEVTVVGCKNLIDKKWISKQDPYSCVEYGSDKFKTRICKGGGTNPTFQHEKFKFTLIEGHQEINIIVWNHNTLRVDDFIGSRVILQGFDDSSWPLQTARGRYAGEIKLIMRYQKLNKPAPPHPPYPPSSTNPPGPSCPSAYLQVPACPPPPIVPAPATYLAHAYPPQLAVYPQPTYPPQSYLPQPAVYPPPTYPPPSPYHPSYPGY